MKSLFIIFFAILSTLLYSCEVEEVSKDTYSIAIITTADLQSKVEPFEYNNNGDNILVGGMARIAEAASDARKTVDHSLFISSGDDLSGAFYYYEKGIPEMKLMTMAGYDVATPGNHEFDYGWEFYRNALRYADFDIVSSNLNIDNHELAERIHPYVVKYLGNIKVGIFGIMTPDLRILSTPGSGISVTQDYFTVARNMVKQLQELDCKIIIAAVHISDNLYAELAEKVDGIDIIVGGHSHKFTYLTIDKGNNKQTVIVEDGQLGSHLGVLRFQYQKGTLSNFDWETVLLDSTIKSNSRISKEVEKFTASYKDSTDKKIAETLVDINALESSVRYGEANSGNMICDAWLHWFEEAEVSLINSGTIRGDDILPIGDLSYNDILQLQPYRNYIYKAELTGAELNQVLEISGSALRFIGEEECTDGKRPSNGAFLQVGGIRFTIDSTETPFCAKYNGKELDELINTGSRIKNIEVFQSGTWQPINENKTYIVLINDYMLNGGDGYYVFLNPDISRTNTTMLNIDLLVQYIQAHSPISPKIDGRIRIVGD